MRNCAVVDSAGNVVNRVVLDEHSEWSAPEGFTVVEDKAVQIGGKYVNGKYTPPVREAPQTFPSLKSLTPLQKLEAIGLTPADLKVLLK